MFTGIIEALGIVKSIEEEGSNYHFCIESTISHALKVDQSLSHSGVCLTVTKIEGGSHWVTAIRETLQKSTFNKLHENDLVNLERCMIANGRFDGHIVQGHVDQTAICKKVKNENGSWLFVFEYDASTGNVTVEKGSICVNGVSLTCFNSRQNEFTVAIIPYTFENTTFKNLKAGDAVNLEFDILGKYVKRLLEDR